MINEKILKNEETAVFKLRGLYSSFGYSLYKMNKFEEYDLYVRNKDFLISDRVITFTDTNGKLLALKPDVTLSIINSFGKNPRGVHKMYYDENVYRVSGSTGRFKEIMQTGLECIGQIGLYEIAEVLMLAIKSLTVIDSNFSLELAHAGITASLLKDAEISDNALPQVIESISVKSISACEQLCKEDIISEEQLKLIEKMIITYSDIKSFEDTFREYVITDECKRSFTEFIETVNAVSSAYTENKITVNLSLSSDSGYYSGIIFKGYINGIATSVLSGGQYDKLIKKIGNTGGAVGFAVYLDSFERFKREAPEFDVDVLVVKNENAAPQEILALVQSITNGGESVLVVNDIPKNLRYRRVLEAEV